MTDRSPAWPQGAIFTLGHSTLSIEAFVALLQTYGIKTLCDIRTVPRSRHNPQFNTEVLGETLAPYAIVYRPMPALGGLRRAAKDSINIGWRNASFRGYADYMQTPAFNAAVDQLIEVGRTSRTAIMCAEAVPWRCHRSLVADALEVRGVEAVEILSSTSWRIHKMTPFARIDGTQITYPAAASKP